MRWLRWGVIAFACCLLLLGIDTCLSVGASAPQQPEFGYSGGSCNIAMCGELTDRDAWLAAWSPWRSGFLLFLSGQLLLVAVPTPNRRPLTGLTRRPPRTRVVEGIVLLVALLWLLFGTFIAELSGYHKGVFVALLSSLPLWFVFSRWVPGQGFLWGRVLTLAAAYVPGVLQVAPRLRVVLADPDAQPSNRATLAPLLMAVVAVLIAYAVGSAVERRALPSGEPGTDTGELAPPGPSNTAG